MSQDQNKPYQVVVKGGFPLAYSRAGLIELMAKYPHNQKSGIKQSHIRFHGKRLKGEHFWSFADAAISWRQINSFESPTSKRIGN